MNKLDYYIKAFSSLHTDKGKNRYPFITKHRAPHKPILLLSIIDLIEEGTIQDNFIELTPELGETFTGYWSIVMPLDKKGKIVYPFFHLRREPFWQLLPNTGQKEVLKSTREISSIYRLLKMISGAKLDDDLFVLLCNVQDRNILRTVLIQNYFDTSVAEQIISQSNINVESYKYSLNLLKEEPKVLYPEIGDETNKEKVRDQGFRKAVVKAYDHRCSFCGIRMRTPDGHTAVDGAHIIPWSESHNDLPQNGISLCKLCHWTFDEGLISISDKYKVLISNRLNSNNNIAGHLITFENRDIIKPDERYLWPAQESIAYHQKVKFRKR
jgi:putative restriction endonuclease